MPRKPKRPVLIPDALSWLMAGSVRHMKKENRRYEKYQRDPETRRWYGRAWKRIRDRYIKAHPLCEECKRNGKLTPSEEVHHVVPLREGGTHKESNLMALCKSCHSRIHAERGDRWS